MLCFDCVFIRLSYYGQLLEHLVLPYCLFTVIVAFVHSGYWLERYMDSTRIFCVLGQRGGRAKGTGGRRQVETGHMSLVPGDMWGQLWEGHGRWHRGNCPSLLPHPS